MGGFLLFGCSKEPNTEGQQGYTQNRIEVNKVEATVVYALPIIPDTPNGGREAVGVLPFVSDTPPF